MANQEMQRGAARRGTLEVLPNHIRGQPERACDGGRDSPKKERPATAPLSPMVKTTVNGGCARRTAMVPPVAAPRTASVPVAFATKRGESGSNVGVCMVGEVDQSTKRRGCRVKKTG